jgi:hypothetical protein
VFKVKDISNIFYILVSLFIYCPKNKEYCLNIISLKCIYYNIAKDALGLTIVAVSLVYSP